MHVFLCKMERGSKMVTERSENMIPEDESCIDGLIPESVISETGEQRIRVATGLATMPKLFFDVNRLKLYTYLNQTLRSGRLRRIVGFTFTDRVINKSICNFSGWEFRRINRDNFFTYVFFTLTLRTEEGPRIWKGYIEVWCSFKETFTCSIEDIGPISELPEQNATIRLSPFMVPYMYGYELDRECENILEDYLPGSITDPKKWDAEKLAERYGLSILYLPVHDEFENGSILFFAAGKLAVKEEDRGRKYMRKEDREREDKENPPKTAEKNVLTPFANAHVDQCCLRFLRIYIPSCLGKYTFGRMNFDADYVEKTLFFLEDSANQGVFNEMEAEQKYKDAFPTTFPEGLRQLMDQAGITVEKMAEKLNMEERTFQRWMAKEDKRFTEDFVIMVSLILELPDWIGDLLLDRAGIALSNKNPRHLALQWIRRAMWKDGIQKANEYLKERNFKPLSI